MALRAFRSIFFCVVMAFATTCVFSEQAPVVEASLGYEAPEQAADIGEAPVEQSPEESSEQVAETPEVQQVEQSQSSDAPTVLPSGQRLQKLETQLNNIANMNLPQEIALLRQQVAQLRGQLEVQAHDLELTNKQLRSFYQDLNNRINQMKNLNSGDKTDTTETSTVPMSVELQDTNTYQAAFSKLVNRQLDKAKQGFEKYLSQYPNGKYVAGSHYWLGEIYLNQKDYKTALTEFQIVLEKFPTSAKVADAKLKLAIIHANLGNLSEAKEELRSIKAKHPDSSAAQLAKLRLQQLEAQ